MTPELDEEFKASDSDDVLRADGESSRGRFDLLTVIAHEMGHLLGLEHSERADSLMEDALGVGERRLPSVEDFDAVFENFVELQG